MRKETKGYTTQFINEGQSKNQEQIQRDFILQLFHVQNYRYFTTKTMHSLFIVNKYFQTCSFYFLFSGFIIIECDFFILWSSLFHWAFSSFTTFSVLQFFEKSFTIVFDYLECFRSFFPFQCNKLYFFCAKNLN